MRIGAEIPLNKNVSVCGETMDARHGTKRETYAGMRARFCMLLPAPEVKENLKVI